MEKMYQNLFTVICLFCSYKDIISLSLINKYTYQSITKDVWRNIGKRDHPLLEIQTKQDYYLKNPLFVCQHKLLDEINKNPWSKQLYNKKCLNLNNVENHLYKAYVTDIMKCMIKVENLRIFYKEHRKNKTTDWGICVQILIQELLNDSEDMKIEIDN
jgi:hypothetical protein